MGLNLCGQLVESLGLKIVGNEILPGTCIPHEDELRSKYGVSRTVTREAIRSLAAKGLVESRPKIGTTVSNREMWNYLDPQILDWSVTTDSDGSFYYHMVQFRQAIEPEAAAFVAKYGSAEEIANIEKLAHQMSESIGESDAYFKADLAFHLSILRAAKNPLFGPIIKVITFSLNYSLKLTNPNSAKNKTSVPLHLAVANAISSRQPELARMAMHGHFQNLMERIQAHFAVQKAN